MAIISKIVNISIGFVKGSSASPRGIKLFTVYFDKSKYSTGQGAGLVKICYNCLQEI